MQGLLTYGVALGEALRTWSASMTRTGSCWAGRTGHARTPCAPAVEQSVRRDAPPEQLRLESSRLGGDVGALGAAALFLQSELSPPPAEPCPSPALPRPALPPCPASRRCDSEPLPGRKRFRITHPRLRTAGSAAPAVLSGQRTAGDDGSPTPGGGGGSPPPGRLPCPHAPTQVRQSPGRASHARHAPRSRRAGRRRGRRGRRSAACGRARRRRGSRRWWSQGPGRRG